MDGRKMLVQKNIPDAVKILSSAEADLGNSPAVSDLRTLKILGDATIWKAT